MWKGDPMPYLKFEVKPGHVELWQSIFEHLEEGEADANLQDKMDAFGPQVDGELEDLIEEYGTEEAFRVEFWNHKDTKFSVMIYSSDPDHEEALVKMLSACPITNLHYGEDANR